MSFIKSLNVGINNLVFNHKFETLEKDINKLDPNEIHSIDVPNTILSRLRTLNQYVATKAPMQSSTQVQGLAYELDKKISKSGIPAEMKKDFSARLQKAVSSSFCKLPNDIIVHIGSFLQTNSEISAFGQVNHQTQNALTLPKAALMRRENWKNESIFIESHIQHLKEKIQEINSLALAQCSMLSPLANMDERFLLQLFNSDSKSTIQLMNSRNIPEFNHILGSLFDLIDEKKELEKQIVKLESRQLKFPNFLTKLASGYVHLLQEIHSLNDNDLKDPIKLETLYQKIQSAKSYLVQNKLNTLEMSCLTNHLVYVFQKKLENAPESDAKKELQSNLNQVVPVGFGHFPHDILFLIFKDLDLKDIVTFRTVCRDLCTFIDSKFAKTELFLRKKISFLRYQTHQLQLEVAKINNMFIDHSNQLQITKWSIRNNLGFSNDAVTKTYLEDALYFNWLNTERNRIEQLTALRFLENSQDQFPSSLNCSEIVNLDCCKTSTDLFNSAPFLFSHKFKQVLILKNKLRDLQFERISLQNKFNEICEIINQKNKILDAELNDKYKEDVKIIQALELKLKNAHDALWFNGINLANTAKELEELQKSKQKK